MRSLSTYTRYVTAIGGGLAASYKSTGQTRYQIANVRGDVVAEADQNGLQQVAAVDEFGVPEDGALPEGRRYGFMGSHQREALTPGGTVAMGVRLYVPTAGRFAQVDPVLGGSDSTYEYASQDPVNLIDLDGKRVVYPCGHKRTCKGGGPSNYAVLCVAHGWVGVVRKGVKVITWGCLAWATVRLFR